MRILQVRSRRLPSRRPGRADEDEGWTVDLEEADGTGIRTASPRLLDIVGATLYGPAWPRELAGEISVEMEHEVSIEVEGDEGAGRYLVRRAMRDGRPGPASLVRPGASAHGAGPMSDEEALAGLLDMSAEAFLRASLLPQRGFAAFLRASTGERGPLLDELTGPGLCGEIASMACRRYRVRRATDPRPDTGDLQGARDELARTLDELGAMEALLDLRAEEARRREGAARSEMELRDLDRRRADLDRDKALFVPLRDRLERGREALELGDAYVALRELRQERDRLDLDRMRLKEDMGTARSELQSAEEAFALIEVSFRDELAEQRRLEEMAQTVRELDRQIESGAATAAELAAQLAETEAELEARSARLDEERSGAEKTELSLRETKRYLQVHAVDERLASALPGIRKCFDLFLDAQERRTAAKDAWSRAMSDRQRAQGALDDRQALFSDAAHRSVAVEKGHERAQAALAACLKGKSMEEWRALHARSLRRREELDELGRMSAEERELQDGLRELQERRLKLQHEAHELRLKDAEGTGRLDEMMADVEGLEKRVALLRRLEDLDLMRELLQDGVPCPLCGAATHPYVSGAAVPDAASPQIQLHDAHRALDELRGELAARQARGDRIADEIASIVQEEEEGRARVGELGSAIAEAVASLGLKFGVGVPLMEELDRLRQKERDQLQKARSVIEAAEAAERDLDAATDELERSRSGREELARYHQEALFQLQAAKAEEERARGESRSQEEAFGAVRRELMAHLSLYGYKELPDDGPARLIEALVARVGAYQENGRHKDEMERELAAARAAEATSKRERDALRSRRDELTSQLKAVEAERGSMLQQRLALFGSRDPGEETERMARGVEGLREQLVERRAEKEAATERSQAVQSALHDVETRMAMGRDRIQKEEIAFGKRLLAAGFKNEDDYLSARLSDDERRGLQARLKELAQMDMDITAAREDAIALQMGMQARQGELRASLGDRAAFVRRLLDLSDRAGELYLSLADDEEGERLYREFADGRRPRLRDLGLGMGEDAPRVRELILWAVVERANARLAAAGRDTRSRLGDGELEVITEGGDVSSASLALAWGLADLFGDATWHLWDVELDAPGPEGLRRAEEMAMALRREDETIVAIARGGRAL